MLRYPPSLRAYFFMRTDLELLLRTTTARGVHTPASARLEATETSTLTSAKRTKSTLNDGGTKGKAQTSLADGTPGPQAPELSEKHSEQSLSLQTPTRPPIEEFRKTTLAVTDLTHPSWCEVKYEYGLSWFKQALDGGQSLDSFVSRSGKSINVNQNIARQTSTAQEQGNKVHQALGMDSSRVDEDGQSMTVISKQQPEFQTLEHEWAARLVKMLVKFKALTSDSRRAIVAAREIPVFGVIHDQVIIGSIDQIVRLKTKDSDRVQSTTTERGVDTPSTSHNSKETPTGSKHDASEDTNLTTLSLIEIKTRSSYNLTSLQDRNALHQLNIYCFFLKELLATNPLYDFKPLWNKLGLDSSANLPKDVLESMAFPKLGPKPRSLDDLVYLWHQLVRESDVDKISEELRLVYYLRPASDETGSSSTHDDRTIATDTSLTLDELRQIIRTPAKGLSSLNDTLYSPHFRHIGTRSFLYSFEDAKNLVTSSLEWWHGLRKAVGVSNEHALRCRSCEFSQDCEWREEKALELVDPMFSPFLNWKPKPQTKPRFRGHRVRVAVDPSKWFPLPKGKD